ncbi:hypothetical protein FQA39_LY03780 [Lamprigera yunnana]|nr:hypothetical protein FQA39_LY03780 [Lamprigera yunnana]
MESETKVTKSPYPQIFAVMVKNCLMLSFGMNLGYPTILIGGILSEDSDKLSTTENSVSWMGSIGLLTVPVGGLLSGIVMQPFGRKRIMQLITIPFIFCWIIFYFSNKLWHIYLSLALVGFFGGLVEAPFSAYVSEITEAHLRGVLLTSGNIFFVLGIFIEFMLGTFCHWRNCALISCIFPTITFVLFFFVPESPYWLLQKNKIDKARKDLAWLRKGTGTDDIEVELQEMWNRHIMRSNVSDVSKQSDVYQMKAPVSGLSISEQAKLFFKNSFLWPFGIVTFATFLAMFDGAITIQTYAISMFATLNVPLNTYHAAVSLAASQLIASLLSAMLIHILGRRKTVFLSLTGVALCNVFIAIYAYVNGITNIILRTESETTDIMNAESWIPLSVIIFLCFIDHFGVYMMPWILMGELYSFDTRPMGCGISSTVSYLFNFVSTHFFLPAVSTLTISGIFLIYGINCIIGIIVLCYILPETEGKTLEEITDHFEGIKKLENKVTKRDVTKISNTEKLYLFK